MLLKSCKIIFKRNDIYNNNWINIINDGSYLYFTVQTLDYIKIMITKFINKHGNSLNDIYCNIIHDGPDAVDNEPYYDDIPIEIHVPIGQILIKHIISIELFDTKDLTKYFIFVCLRNKRMSNLKTQFEMIVSKMFLRLNDMYYVQIRQIINNYIYHPYILELCIDMNNLLYRETNNDVRRSLFSLY